MNNRLLATRDADYLGSYLYERLLNEGCDVASEDNYFSANKQNTADLLSKSHFEATSQDITFPFYIKIDLVYIFACLTSLINHQADPKRQQSNITLACENVSLVSNMSLEDGLKEIVA